MYCRQQKYFVLKSASSWNYQFSAHAIAGRGMTWREKRSVSLNKSVKMWWHVWLRLIGVQTLQILIILLFLFKWSLRIVLIKLVRNERKSTWC